MQCPGPRDVDAPRHQPVLRQWGDAGFQDLTERPARLANDQAEPVLERGAGQELQHAADGRGRVYLALENRPLGRVLG